MYLVTYHHWRTVNKSIYQEPTKCLYIKFMAKLVDFLLWKYPKPKSLMNENGYNLRYVLSRGSTLI